MSGKARRVTCKYCKKVLTIYHLKEHLRTHTGEKPLQCPYCSYRTAAASGLRSHVMRRLSTPVKCQDCDFTSCTSFMLNKHRSLHANEVSTSSPEKCPSRTISSTISEGSSISEESVEAPTAVSQASGVSKEKKLWKVPKIPKAFLIYPSHITTEVITKAVQSLKEEDGKIKSTPLHCKYCSFGSYDTFKLAEHIRARRSGSPIRCHQCSFKSCTSSGIMNHRMEVHFSLAVSTSIVNGTESFKTAEVPEPIGSPKEPPRAKVEPTVRLVRLDLPQRTKLQGNKDAYGRSICTYEDCGKKFACKSSLRQHMRCHLGEKRFQCHRCSYTSPYASGLWHHKKLQVKHKGVLFKCPECNFSSCTPVLLNNHKKDVHGLEIPRKLLASGRKREIAGSVLPTNHQVKKRRLNPFLVKKTRKIVAKKSTSSKKKDNFRCQYCSFACNQREKLVVHIRTHTGEKPYSCPVCPHRSARSYDMKMHVQKIHQRNY